MTVSSRVPSPAPHAQIGDFLSIPVIHEGGTPILTVPGLYGSSDRHWQSIWERERSDCTRVQLGLWNNPSPSLWLARLDESVRALTAPGVLVAHSLGCLATAAWLSENQAAAKRHLRGVLLVAPCNPSCGREPGLLRRFGVPRTPLPVPAVVVASANDPYAALPWSAHLAADWGAGFINLGEAGHINADSGLGAWRYGQSLLAAFLRECGDTDTERALQ